MKHIAITGATGVVGTRFRERFNSYKFSIFKGDIRNFLEVKEFCKTIAECDGFLHLAALVPKQIVDSDPSEAFDINVRGTLNVLESLKTLRNYTPWLFFASTSHVYASKSTAITESDELKPFTTYGLTKLQGEEWCRNYSREYGLKICMGRIFSFSDPLQSDYYFLPAMVKRIRNTPQNGTLSISGVTGKRDFLRVGQIVQTIDQLCDSKVVGEINIGTGVGSSLTEIIKLIAAKLNRTDIKFDIKNDPPNYLIANTDKLKKLNLNIENQIELLIEDLTREQK